MAQPSWPYWLQAPGWWETRRLYDIVRFTCKRCGSVQQQVVSRHYRACECIEVECRHPHKIAKGERGGTSCEKT